jgi:hypothetical protein
MMGAKRALIFIVDLQNLDEPTLAIQHDYNSYTNHGLQANSLEQHVPTPMGVWTSSNKPVHHSFFQPQVSNPRFISSAPHPFPLDSRHMVDNLDAYSQS